MPHVMSAYAKASRDDLTPADRKALVAKIKKEGVNR